MTLINKSKEAHVRVTVSEWHGPEASWSDKFMLNISQWSPNCGKQTEDLGSVGRSLRGSGLESERSYKGDLKSDE